MLIIEFTNAYGDVGRVEILRIFHPCQKKPASRVPDNLSGQLDI